MIKKKLFIVGAGPGDPELITVKAVNALIKSDFIFYPDVCGGKNKIAYDIIKNALKFAGVPNFAEERLIPLEVEMKRSTGRNKDLYKENAVKIIEKLKEGVCSYVTLGDPMFYSTYWGLHNAIREVLKEDRISINIVNGVSSFHYSIGLIGEPYIIKNSSVLISVPVKKDLTEIEDEIRFIAGKLPKPQVIVFMKAGSYVKEILKAFRELCREELKGGGLKLYLIEKSMLIEDFEKREELNFDYFSIFIGVFV
ncbi:MAG: precorrin-2 C(20)-methyltransferase [Deltaproteobacteria bacterium]|jgi:precorrin-2 C(20)-methyltransferase|nr:precorrin-2 C(20)-methyltransferase [Deltaproteobacteria bacterium]